MPSPLGPASEASEPQQVLRGLDAVFITPYPTRSSRARGLRAYWFSGYAAPVGGRRILPPEPPHGHHATSDHQPKKALVTRCIVRILE